MHRYLTGISANLECPAIIVGGTTDHIHLLANQSRTITLAEWVKELKRASSLWAKKKSRQWSLFQWQAGYGDFRSASRKKNEYRNISESRKSIIDRFRFRTNFVRF